MKRYTIEIRLPIRLNITAATQDEARAEAVSVAYDETTPDMMREAWALWAEMHDQTYLVGAEEVDSVWIVETLTLCDGWVNCWTDDAGGENEKKTTFSNRHEAQAEFSQHVHDLAVAGMEFDPQDFRITEIMPSELSSNTDEA